MATKFVDTNIFIYAVGTAHPMKRVCALLIEKIARQDIDVVTDTEVLQEVLYRFWKQGKAERGMITYNRIVDLMQNILPVSREDLGCSG